MGIAHTVKDALILVDNQAHITYWNPAAEAAFGYSKEEAIGKNIHELVIPKTTYIQTKDRIQESVEAFSETGIGYFTSGNIEVIALRKDGTEFPAELTISAMRKGSDWNAVGVVKDISARKQANQKLKEAEQKYRTLFNQSPLGVMIIDPETLRFVEFNDTAHLQLGYNREEFEQLTLSHIQAELTTDQIRERVNNSLEKDSNEFETKHFTKTGEVRNIIVTSKVVKTDGKAALHCIVHDVTDSKKVQEALMASEARFRQLIDVAHEGIWAVDNDFETVFVNPFITQLLGYREDEMIGKNMFDFIDPNWVPIIKGILLGFKGADAKGQYDYAFPTKNGGHIQTSVNVSVITDDNKQKIGILAVISDTTKRKQLEEDLRSSEERFRAISTSAMDAIVLSDNKDHILYWNPAAQKMYGYTQEEAVGKKLSELIIPVEAHKKHEQLLEKLNQGRISQREFGLKALRKNGTTFSVDLSVVSIQLKSQNCLLSIIKDVTEWKEMEEKLRQERDVLESVTKSTNIILAIINRDFRITWGNEKAKLVTNRGGLEGRYCYEVFGQGANKVCEGCGIKRVFDDGENLVRRDYRLIDNNKEKWVELISTPIKDTQGQVVAALEISIDITERKRLQNKLGEYSQRLEEIVQKRTDELKKTQAELVKSERLAAIGELAGMIGHDLRNPLTGIKNSAYFLKKKGNQLPPEAKVMLDTIDKCVDYSNRIINDLLDYSREIHLTLEKQSPKKLLEESLALISIPEKVRINNRIEETQNILVDSDKIKRVFINLIRNAIEAMPEGGDITVDSQTIEGNIEISFVDNGEGISEEVLPKLFAPLFTTKAQGMGFGLAICKRIIEAHKGSIAVRTVQGQGTTFTLTLPVNPGIESGGEGTYG